MTEQTHGNMESRGFLRETDWPWEIGRTNIYENFMIYSISKNKLAQYLF